MTADVPEDLKAVAVEAAANAYVGYYDRLRGHKGVPDECDYGQAMEVVDAVLPLVADHYEAQIELHAGYSDADTQTAAAMATRAINAEVQLRDAQAETERLNDVVACLDRINDETNTELIDTLRVMHAARAERDALRERITALCDAAEQDGQGIVITPGFSTYYAVDSGLLRSTLTVGAGDTGHVDSDSLPVPVVECPQCGASIRARMPDTEREGSR